MASPGTDIASALPIRSEADGTDERVQTKLVDATNPDTQQMEIDTDNNAHVEVHGDNPTGTDTTLRLSELGAPNPDGDYDVTNNTKPASSGLIAHDRNATVTDAHQNKRVTAVAGADDTVCLDIAVRDEAGQPYTQDNPLPVSLEESEGDEVAHYHESAAPIAKNASDNHDYTVSAGKTLIGESVWASASGKMSLEVQVETGVATGVFNTVAVGFNSTANPNIDLSVKKKVKVATGVRVRIIKTNLDNQAQTLYSTLFGDEK